MPSAKHRASLVWKAQLDAAFLTTIFWEGCLAASPYAETVADPFVCGRKDDAPTVPFTFSDIPDFHFREPHIVIPMSSIGGAKS